MITQKNYFEEVNRIGADKLPEVLKKGHDFVTRATNSGANWKTASDSINKTIELQVAKLNEWAAAQKPQKKAGMHNAKYKDGQIVSYKGKNYKVDGVLTPIFPGKLGLEFEYNLVNINTGITAFENVKEDELGEKIKEESGQHPQKKKKTARDFINSRPRRQAETARKGMVPYFNEKYRKEKPQTKAAKEKRPRVEKAKKVGSSGEPVEHISPAVAIIKRFANMHGKQVSYDKLMALLRTLQKQITEKVIRKADKYAEQIKEIQTFLVARANENVSVFSITLSEKRLEQFQKIAGSETKMLIVTLLKQYVGLVGKTDVKDRAKNLLERIKKYEDKEEITAKDKYYNFLEVAVKRLKEYVSGKEKTVKPTITELNGLQGIGCDCEHALGTVYKPTHNGRLLKKPLRQLKDKYYSDAKGRGTGSHHGGLSGTEDENLGASYKADKEKVMRGPEKATGLEHILQQEFKTVGITGNWKKLLGELCFPFYILAYGEGGSGKSGMCLSLGQHLSELGHDTLFVPAETYGTPTFQLLVTEAGIKGNEHYHFHPTAKGEDLSKYKVVILDSKDSAKLSIDDFRALKKKYPRTSFIITSQGKKNGDFRGSEEWRNEVDALIYFPEPGKASTANEKNRFGGHEEVQMFESKRKQQA